MIRTLTQGLSSRWRTMDVQQESGTRRSQQETLEMVRTGYQTAIDMIDERCKKHPQDWKTLTLAGSLLGDWGDFEYYQQLAGDTSTDRMASFREKNNQAETYFARAAEAYAKEVEKLTARQFSIDDLPGLVPQSAGHQFRRAAEPVEAAGSPGAERAPRHDPRASRTSPPGPHQPVCQARQARLEDTENPLHEELKYKYLAGSLVITKESPFAFQAGDKVAYYDELLDEIRLDHPRRRPQQHRPRSGVRHPVQRPSYRSDGADGRFRQVPGERVAARQFARRRRAIEQQPRAHLPNGRTAGPPR